MEETLVTYAGKKSPKDNPKKEAQVIDCASITASKAKDDGFSNNGEDVNKVPQSEHLVENYHLSY